jgi:hypothetical protein
MEPWQLLLFVLGAFAIGYSLLKSSRPRQDRRGKDSLAAAHEEVQSLESSARGIVQKLEVRAYDYSRDVEARIDNRLSVLDRLIVDADREIERLQAMLAESRRASAVDRELTPDEQQRCFALRESGFEIAEIARCLNASAVSIQHALDEWQRPDRRAA